MLTIRVVPGAPLETNCYLVADREAGEAIVVDAPAQVADEIAELAEELGITVRQIICTHGHWDHTMGLTELMLATHATVACHANDAELLEHPTFAPFNFPFTLTPVTPDLLLEDGETIDVGSHTLTVLATPGHTPGCLCLYDEVAGVLLSGDTLFAGTCGRVDFPGSNPAAMVTSLRRLAELPENTQVYPGHGEATTIGDEQAWMVAIN